MIRKIIRNYRTWLVVIAAVTLVSCSPTVPDAPGTVDDTPVPPAIDDATVATPFRVEQAVVKTYEPGGLYHGVVTMDYTGEEPVTALAIRIRLPEGWQYAGVTGDLRPAVEPAAGAQDELTMVWIQIPEFPATLAYVLDVPESQAGPCVLSVDAVYRTLGGELHSPVDTVTLNAME